MNIQLSSEIEKKNLEEKTKPSWELYSGPSIVEAVRQAKDMGWKQKKVQVRYEEGVNGITYYIEPYEKGCGCRGLLKYRDFFD